MYIPGSVIIALLVFGFLSRSQQEDDTTLGEAVVGLLLLIGFFIALAAILGAWVLLTAVISDAYKLNPALVAAGIFFGAYGIYDEVMTWKANRKK